MILLKIALGRLNQIYSDGNRIGWYFFPPSLLTIKVNGIKIRMLYEREVGMKIISGIKQVGLFKDGVLEYQGIKYKIEPVDIDSGPSRAIVRISNNCTIAKEAEMRSIEYIGPVDPVLLAFSIFSLCIVVARPATSSANIFSEATFSFLYGKERVSPAVYLMGLIPLLVLAVSFALGQKYSSGAIGNLLILSLGLSIIGYTLFVIFALYYRRRGYLLIKS